ncbi:MAG: hypothetical protein ABFE08_16495 [Armatimonadia bacterium]
MSYGRQTGVEVNLSFFPLAWFVFFCTPRVEIDGVCQTMPWGTHVLPTTPGMHRVKVYFPYMLMPQCGANTIDVMVSEGSTTRLKYYMWPWMFAKGSLDQIR